MFLFQSNVLIIRLFWTNQEHIFRVYFILRRRGKIFSQVKIVFKQRFERRWMSVELSYYVKTIMVFYQFQDFFFRQHSLMNQEDFTWQETWRTSIHLFKVHWNDHLVNFFPLMYRYGINTNTLQNFDHFV